MTMEIAVSAAIILAMTWALIKGAGVFAKGDVRMGYETVKRHAEIGEKILITDADMAVGEYEDGDILTVRAHFRAPYGDPGGWVRTEETTIVVAPDEYEVITESIIEKGDDKMAKLDVKVIGMEDGEITEVEFDGDKYEKIEGEPEVDDLARSTVAGIDVTLGGFYSIEALSTSAYVAITDDANDSHSRSKETLEFFRKVSEPSTEERLGNLETRVDALEKGEKSADPRAKFEGVEKVRLISGGGEFPLNGYTDGEIYSVGDVYSDDLGGVVQIKGGRIPNGYAKPHQIEPIKEFSKPAQVGDIIRIVNAHISCRGIDYDNGDVMTVERVDSVEDVIKTDKFRGYIRDGEFEIIGRTGDIKDADPRSKFAKGDRVRLLSGGDSWPLHGYIDGKVYEVENPKWGGHDNERVAIEGSDVGNGFALPSEIEKVDHESLEVGDYAKIISLDDTKEDRGTPTGYEVGNIVELVSTSDKRDGTKGFKVKRLDGKGGLANNVVASDLAPLTTEEEKEAKDAEEKAQSLEVGSYAKVVGDMRWGDLTGVEFVKVAGGIDSDGEQKIEPVRGGYDYDYAKPSALEKVELSERELSFVRAGREINDVRKGDIVRVAVDVGGHPVGTIGIANGEEKVEANGEKWAHSIVELVAKVSDRADSVE